MKIKLGVIFGGKSTEHEISIISALQAIQSIDKSKYDVVPLYITKDNKFYFGECVGDIDEYKNIPALIKKSRRVVLVPDGNTAKIIAYPHRAFEKSELGYIDIAFPIVHGTNVEDGTLAGFIEMLNIPYVGCDVLSSALGMDKYAMKTVFADNNIPTLPCRVYTTPEFEQGEKIYDDIEKTFGYPVIVKPVNLGSSVGITLAADREKLRDALELAFTFSDRVLTERAITELREINCAVLGDRFSAEASECEEPISADEILSYSDKYMSGAKGKSGHGKGMAQAQRKIPAELSKEMRDEIRAIAVNAFRALGCCGVARIDFLIDKAENKIYLNEINTIPGSLSFYLFEPLGIKYGDLLDRMIKLALTRARRRKSLTYSFETNVLSGVSLGKKVK